MSYLLHPGGQLRITVFDPVPGNDGVSRCPGGHPLLEESSCDCHEADASRGGTYFPFGETVRTCTDGSFEEQVVLFAAVMRLAYATGCGFFGASDPTAYLAQRRGRLTDWEEALITAVVGPWFDPVETPEGLSASVAYDSLMRDIDDAHRNQTPLWRRKTGGLRRDGRRVEGRRLALLEAPRGGTTLRDVFAGDLYSDGPLLDSVPSDRRIVWLLDRLTPAHRMVVLALGQPGVMTWADAAHFVGAPDPERFGENVRAKVRRLVREQQRRDGMRRPGSARLV
ncbi:hypothetical protein [Streptomyces sp. CS62]|uniref:hypothetical protein n=1 Tax=Streptomyces sp. CS62 TaxID=3119268 RepID=UPI002F947CE8